MSVDTICAPATGRGGAIAVIRVSGPAAVAAVDAIFAARGGSKLAAAAGYTVHFGEVAAATGSQATQREIIDDVLVTVFRAPHSYTGEDSVEISCHASPYIEGRIIESLAGQGVRLATPGEFTARAFLAGKIDLAQAEAVADLIASQDRSQHALAMAQMRGGVSTAIAELRNQGVGLAALLELELDFGEEDVEFASRPRLASLAEKIAAEVDRLASSFALGNAIREGVPVAIVGRPNAGKSTLLNALVGDDRAMVSEIAGTTRDRVEERVVVDGVTFRLIDTAGLRATDDVLERMGIERSLAAVSEAAIVLLVVDGTAPFGVDDLDLRPGQRLCVVVNKADISDSAVDGLRISAKTGEGLDELRRWLVSAVDVGAVDGATISSARHLEALTLARAAVERVSAGLSGNFSADLLAADVRELLHHLGTITGAVTTDEILGQIFSKFCIGK